MSKRMSGHSLLAVLNMLMKLGLNQAQAWHSVLHLQMCVHITAAQAREELAASQAKGRCLFAMEPATPPDCSQDARSSAAQVRQCFTSADSHKGQSNAA